MKKKLIMVSYLVLLVAAVVVAQVPGDVLWMRTYGDAEWNCGRCVQATADGGAIISGFTVAPDGHQDGYMLKTDDVGDTLWTKCIGDEGAEDMKSIQELPNGGYVLVGYDQAPGIFGCDIFLVRTDAVGDIIWTRTFGDSEAMLGGTNNGHCVDLTSDGGFIIAGGSQFQGPYNEDCWLIKASAFGDTLWSRFFGGPAFETAYSVEQASDDGFILVGYTMSFGEGNEDIYLVKTDALGNLEWSRTFGGTGSDVGRCVRQTSDGGYIITGYTSSFGAGGFDVYLVKTDALGETLWTRTFGGGSDDISYSVQITADEGYIISGKTASFGAGGYDTYLIETDATGEALWSRAYGGSGTDKGYFVQLTQDGDYLVTGETTSYGEGDYDILLMKIGAQVSSVEDHQTIPTKPIILSQNYPNPFNPTTTIFFELQQETIVELAIYNLSGSLVKILVSENKAAGAHQVIWDGRDDMGGEVASGVYVYRLKAGEIVEARKMVLNK